MATIALPSGVVSRVRTYATASCSQVGLLGRFVKKVRGVRANEYPALKFDERTKKWIQMDSMELLASFGQS